MKFKTGKQLPERSYLKKKITITFLSLDKWPFRSTPEAISFNFFRSQ